MALRAVVTELEHLEQLGHRSVSFFATRLKLMRHVGAQVVFDEQLVQRAKRLLNRQRQRDDVDAIVFVLDHFFEPTHLSFENAGAVQCALLDVFDHRSRLPPYGIPGEGTERLMANIAQQVTVVA